jgi:hypothetical protein
MLAMRSLKNGQRGRHSQLAMMGSGWTRSRRSCDEGPAGVRPDAVLHACSGDSSRGQEQEACHPPAAGGSRAGCPAPPGPPAVPGSLRTRRRRPPPAARAPVAGCSLTPGLPTAHAVRGRPGIGPRHLVGSQTTITPAGGEAARRWIGALPATAAPPAPAAPSTPGPGCRAGARPGPAPPARRSASPPPAPPRAGTSPRRAARWW